MLVTELEATTTMENELLERLGAMICFICGKRPIKTSFITCHVCYAGSRMTELELTEELHDEILKAKHGE